MKQCSHSCKKTNKRKKIKIGKQRHEDNQRKKCPLESMTLLSLRRGRSQIHVNWSQQINRIMAKVNNPYRPEPLLSLKFRLILVSNCGAGTHVFHPTALQMPPVSLNSQLPDILPAWPQLHPTLTFGAARWSHLQPFWGLTSVGLFPKWVPGPGV